MYSADLMNRSQTRPEIGEGRLETVYWAFRCRRPLFPLVRGVRRELVPWKRDFCNEFRSK
jgi:hypothetical protein